jgi:hypothetical protein
MRLAMTHGLDPLLVRHLLLLVFAVDLFRRALALISEKSAMLDQCT